MSILGTVLSGIASGGLSFWKDLWGMKRQDDYKEWLADREDTAVQRRAKDLEAAGLSKTLAAGSAATSGAVSISGPNGGQMADALGAAMQVAAIRNARQENANMKKSNEVMDNQIKDLQADVLLKGANARQADANAAYMLKNANFIDQQIAESAQRIKESIERSKGYKFDSEAKHATALLNNLQFRVFRDTGVSPSMNGALGDLLRRLEKHGPKEPVFSYPYKEFKW